MKKLLNKKGFTLIELIVVIAILAILALILVPSITGYIAEANKAKDSANARSKYSEIALQVATTNVTNGTYTVSAGTLSCSYTVADKEVTVFACGSYSLANNFQP